MAKPHLLYRLSKDGKLLYLRVPDNDTEKDAVLMFNRIMADYGFTNPKEHFKERLGVAAFPSKIKLREDDRLYTYHLLNVLENHFTMLPITNRDWYSKRF